MRFVVNEQSLMCSDQSTWSEIEGEFDNLAGLLDELRSMDEPVGILDGWGGIETRLGGDRAALLAGQREIDREVRGRLLRLLDKCVSWDSDADVVVNGDLVIGDDCYYSLGIGRALQLTCEGRATAVVATRWPGWRGTRRVAGDGLAETLCFVVSDDTCGTFYGRCSRSMTCPNRSSSSSRSRRSPDSASSIPSRSVGSPEVTRCGMMSCGTSLRSTTISDGYTWRVQRKLRRDLRSARGCGEYRREDARIEESDEGTRCRVPGVRLRCEWHSKIEPHRNRIHFFPGDERTGGRLVVGIFVDHLRT